MFGFSHWEILAVLAIVVLVFGARKIPALGRSLGFAIREFREGLKKKDDNDSKKEMIDVSSQETPSSKGNDS